MHFLLGEEQGRHFHEIDSFSLFRVWLYLYTGSRPLVVLGPAAPVRYYIGYKMISHYKYNKCSGDMLGFWKKSRKNNNIRESRIVPRG